MKIRSVSLQNFRNFRQQRFEFGETSWFLVGPNGRGKTNLLEALHLLGSFRSFRTSVMNPLPCWGEKAFGIEFSLLHEKRGTSRIGLRWETGKEKLILEEGDQRLKLGEFLGLFPVVALTSDDVELIRGAPGIRRRQQDLFLSTLSAEYFHHLRMYHHALKQRNALLRQEQAADSLFVPFEQRMAVDGVRLEQIRREISGELEQRMAERYGQMVPQGEPLALAFEQDLPATEPGELMEFWKKRRGQDRMVGTTRRGPHRSDWKFILKDHQAREFASEGQQRGLVLTFRLAQFDLLHQQGGITPVLLADDVLHELDQTRREYFWQTLPEAVQLFASGTQLPGDWKSRGGEVLNFS